MAELTVERTYGRALFEAARDLNKIEIILEEICEIRELFKDEPKFYEFVKTPVISGIQKKAAINEIFGGKISTEVLNFLYILIDKRRTSNFGKIVDQYQSILDETQGSSKGIIYSMETLTLEQLKAFEEKTSKQIGKNVKLENRLDRSIMGGVKVFIEGKLIDATIRKRLKNLEGSLKCDTL